MSKSIERMFVSVLLCVIAALTAAGCNTVRGVGQDLQEGGKAMQDAATNAQQK